MSLEELFKEMDMHLLQDERPSEYLEEAGNSALFLQRPFELLHRMKKTKQSPNFHPEGNVWIHTMMVVDEAAKRRDLSAEPRVFMWAALLHDIGKPATTSIRKGRITSYNHDREGERLAEEFLTAFSENRTFIEKVCGLVRYHMQILFVSKQMGLTELKEMKRRVDIREAALFGLCDRLGRTGVDVNREKENVRGFLDACGAPEEYYKVAE